MRKDVYQTYKATPAVIEEPEKAAPLDQREISTQDRFLLEALRKGDEDAYTALLRNYHSSMLRRALLHVSNPAVAEEVVQEAWMGIFQGLQHFEGRCTLRTWIFSILVHCAQTRGRREKRCVPFSSLSSSQREVEENEAVVDEALPHPDTSSQELFQHVLFFQQRVQEPEEYLLTKELYTNVSWALNLLPMRLRKIIALRSIEGWTAEEVYLKYHISKTHQRVLLHRARTRIRILLEPYYVSG